MNTDDDDDDDDGSSSCMFGEWATADYLSAACAALGWDWQDWLTASVFDTFDTASDISDTVFDTFMTPWVRGISQLQIGNYMLCYDINVDCFNVYNLQEKAHLP